MYLKLELPFNFMNKMSKDTFDIIDAATIAPQSIFSSARKDTLSSLNAAVENSSRSKSNSKTLFPWKLYKLLEDVANDGKEHIVSWLPHGKA